MGGSHDCKPIRIIHVRLSEFTLALALSLSHAQFSARPFKLGSSLCHRHNGRERVYMSEHERDKDRALVSDFVAVVPYGYGCASRMRPESLEHGKACRMVRCVERLSFDARAKARTAWMCRPCVPKVNGMSHKKSLCCYVRSTLS